MKMDIVRKVFGVVALSLALLLTLHQAVGMLAEKKMELVTTFVAARDIPPRTKIEEADLLEMQVPQAYLMEYACTQKEEIIGRYTEIAGMIPAGSPFYRTMLFEESELPDYPATLLREGQSAYSLAVDLTRAGGSPAAGMYVDVFGTVAGRDGTMVSGALLEHVRILSVKDAQGLSIADPNSSGLPYVVLLAVKSRDVAMLTQIEKAGELRLFASSESYGRGQEAVKAADSSLVEWYEALDVE